MNPSLNTIICGDWVEVAKGLPAGLVQCIITSPPYWGQRNYGVEGQLGLEPTPEIHIEKLVIGFRELRRILRDDGMMFLNYGDKYNSHIGDPQKVGGFQGENIRRNQDYGKSYPFRKYPIKNLKPGDLIGLAWRLALALQADGWYLRSDIIWAKALSFCLTYSGSTMPESVNGWRWERHKIRTKKLRDLKYSVSRTEERGAFTGGGSMSGYSNEGMWQDCPGCEKCEPNDGLVLRKGSWRPTRAHEYLFLLAKSPNYFCDMEAVREEKLDPQDDIRRISKAKEYISNKNNGVAKVNEWQVNESLLSSGRNLRDVFCINPSPYPDAHYATFPEALVEPCIKVGTSQKGCCPKCGSPYARIIDTKQIKRERPADRTDRHNQGNGVNSCGNTVAGVNTTTLGWRPTCKCGIETTTPCIVYDPFMGSGTVAQVAARLGRNYLGSELNPDYITKQAEYRVAEGETGISKQEQKAGQMALWKGE